MKKLLYTIIILLFVAGCKKDDTPPVVIVPTDKDPVISATATTLNPDYKGTCTVSWEVTGIYQSFVVSLNGSQISTEAKSSYKIDSVSENINFYFVCTTKSGKQITKNLGISPKSPPPPVLPKINSFTVDHSTVESGLPVLLNWNISYSKLISITIKPVGKPETTTDGLDSIGSFPYIPKENTTFILKATNQNGEVTDTVKVTVILPPPPKTNMDYVSAHPWTMDSCKYKYYEQDPWMIGGIFAGEKYVYHSYGVAEAFSANGTLIANGPFTINETAISYGYSNSDKWPIVLLNDDVMILRHVEVCYSGCPTDSIIVEYRYKPFTKKK